ncbi:MAG: methylmalonyl-CoA epimerase [Planctomycetales bacterium]|nr:methylmalonyl-CoA epimerase [Planctomycetales bacterium]
MNSLDEHRQFYAETLGAEFEGEEAVESQQVRVAFYKVGDVRLEVLEPTSPESPIAKFIEKRGEGLHHVAYTVDNLPQRIADLQEAGVRMIDSTPRIGAHHMQIAFMHPKSSGGVLTELCEPSH